MKSKAAVAATPKAPKSPKPAGPARRGRPPATAIPLGRRHADQGDTRAAILKAATEEFARSGFDGARIDRISSAAKANDRMIYYYFGSKQKLFIAVLEAVYAELGAAETRLDLDLTDPAGALEAVVRFTFGYYREHLEMISLLNNENLRSGAHVAKSRKVKALSAPLTDVLDRILAAGAAQGLFRPKVASRDLYIAIAALPYFYLSNRHTLSRFLNTDLMSAGEVARWSEFSVEMVLRMVYADGMKIPTLKAAARRAVKRAVKPAVTPRRKIAARRASA